jgi:hypothetical protein
MTDPIEAINDAMEIAVAAQEAGDYAAALRSMESAFIRICALPNSEFDNERLEWDRERIESLIKYLKQRVAETTAGLNGPRGALIQGNPILYTRG